MSCPASLAVLHDVENVIRQRMSSENMCAVRQQRKVFLFTRWLIRFRQDVLREQNDVFPEKGQAKDGSFI